ncbi:MAG TPA: FtsX-like permease family protein [Gemmatimonadaceae bacterium]
MSARPIAYNASGTERPEAPIARWLAAVALIVLIIANANVANLLIVRLLRRRREIAVRLALGISRSRLGRLLILEGMVYAIVGGAAGIGFAYGGAEIMRRVFLSNVVWDTAPVDTRVLLVAMLLTVTTGFMVSFAPLLQTRRADIVVALRGTGGSGGARQSRTRFALLVTQAAFSVLLLTGAGLFMRSLSNVRRLDLGLQPDRVLVGEVDWPRLRNVSPPVAAAERRRETVLWMSLRDYLTRARGVEHAALAIGSPFGYGFGVTLKVPGRDTLPSAPGGGPYVNAVTSEYFATVGTPVVRGRVFGPNEGATTERVAIVNEMMAKLLWPEEDPLGKCIIVGDDETRCSTVVGVVRDARRYGIREDPAMQYYIPFGQEAGFGGTVLLVRPSGDVQSYVSALRRTIAQLVPDASVIDVGVMQDRVDPQIRPWRLGATMFGLFGAIALVVAAIGLYSVVSYVTAQRTHEIGVRLAIGAGARRIVGLIVTDGMRVAVVGAAIGLVLALIASRWIAPLLFNESARDPWVYLGVTVTLLAVAAIACLAPAVRAARVDPVNALRDG